MRKSVKVRRIQFRFQIILTAHRTRPRSVRRRKWETSVFPCFVRVRRKKKNARFPIPPVGKESSPGSNPTKSNESNYGHRKIKNI